MLLPQIKEMLEKGMSHREIEKRLGLSGDRPIHNLLKRERRKELQGIPKQPGRKPAKTLQEYKYENKRLKAVRTIWGCSEHGGFVSNKAVIPVNN